MFYPEKPSRTFGRRGEEWLLGHGGLGTGRSWGGLGNSHRLGRGGHPLDSGLGAPSTPAGALGDGSEVDRGLPIPDDGPCLFPPLQCCDPLAP